MFAPVILFIFSSLLFVERIDGRQFHSRQTDSLTIMRERCAQTPNIDECVRIKSQMEDLLRKCRDMVSPVSACDDVRMKYCFIWPRELFCYSSGGGGGGGIIQVTTRPTSWTNDPDWYQIPSDPQELKSRGDYCVSHQSEQKCRNLLNALKIRYDECSKRPKTDASCQSFKISLCAAFPKFSPCLNGGNGFRKRTTDLERFLHIRRKLLM